MANSPSMLAVVLGAMRTGIVPVVLNPTLQPHELERLLADASPQLVVSDARPLVLGGLRADLAPVPLCRPMHYTSGTSGQPKGVWPGVLTSPDAQAMHDDEAAVWQLGPSDTHLTCSPLYHSVAIRFSAQALLRGASLVLLSSFDAVAAAGAIVREGVRSTFMVPTHLQRLLAVGADVSGIQLLAHAGAPCPPALKRALFDAFAPGSVWEFYGATEGQFTVCPPADWLSHPGTVGRARPGRSLSVDDAGQIWCTVPSFARWSYWGDALKTAAAWRGDAFTVGDVGRLTADGFLFLDGRRDDLIISGGVNVYPAEVEQALLEIPGVDEAAVFGVTDSRWGERVCAAVVGQVSSGFVLDASRPLLAGYKRPKDVYVVDDLPRTATGKVRRSQIAALLGLPGSAADGSATDRSPADGSVTDGSVADGYGADHES
jgi:long-chain acyl-CoA synthetase